MKRWISIVVTMLLVGGAAWLGFERWREPAPVTYTTAPAERGRILQSVTASGTLEPAVQVQVGSQVSGRIKELLADYNDHVTAGQVLARIDPSVFESQVAQAKSRLTSANADLRRTRAIAANAKAQYDRARSMQAAGLVADADVDAALAEWKSQEAQIGAARASITEAQASLDQARSNLAYTTITSPVDGIVISRSVDVGQTVAASLSAPTLFVIAGDLRDMEVHTSVAESDVGQLAAGMKVQFTVDAFPEKTFDGEVKQVRNEATTTSNVVTYDAVVDVRNDALDLRPGMTANVTFVIAERTDVLALSSKALSYRPANARRQRGERGVWVIRDGKPARVAVETGLSDGSQVEITGGELQEGDLVITADSTAKKAAASTGGRQRPPRGPF
jgi:HlyD family secretion protein